MGAHPRSRGENPATTGLTLGFAGSSPLTRGKPGATAAGLAGHGLIPAHAGKTRSGNRRRPSQRAHPRSRGENSAAFGWINGSLGSSPLTRGKHRALGRRRRPGGLIPAHAGKTTDASLSIRRAWAHPRSRGENAPLEPTPERMLGSSPLTRGKPAARLRVNRLLGLIPAHAGKTHPTHPNRNGVGAHPRSRGENTTARWQGSHVVGSSPLTRGKPVMSG